MIFCVSSVNSQVLYKDLQANDIVITNANSGSSVNVEVIVDSLGGGQYTSLTQALAYAKTVHTTNSTKIVTIRLCAGTYTENPTIEPYTIIYGDDRRSKINGLTTCINGPVWLTQIYFIRTVDDGLPVIRFKDMTVTSTFYNNYVYRAATIDAPLYAVEMTNCLDGTSFYMHVQDSELYCRNFSATSNAKTILFKAYSGMYQLVANRLKTSGWSNGQEYMAWLSGAHQMQVERCNWISAHDAQSGIHMDDGSNFLWYDSSLNSDLGITSPLRFEGTSTNRLWYAKETGALNVHGIISLYSGGVTSTVLTSLDQVITNNQLNASLKGTLTASNAVMVVNGTTNQVVVSKVGTNNVSLFWQGTLTEYTNGTVTPIPGGIYFTR